MHSADAKSTSGSSFGDADFQQSLLVQLWSRLSPRRKWQFSIVLLLMISSAFSEIVTLGAVLPFLGVLTAPEKLSRYPFVGSALHGLGLESPSQVILGLACAFSVAAIVSGALRLLQLWATTRLAFVVGADFSIDVYRRTLYQPYTSHLSRNSSEVISGITHKVNDVVEVLYQSLTMISAVILLVAITTTLVFIDPVVALSASVSFGAAYALIAWFSRRRLHVNSQRVASERTQLIKALQEGLGGIRDVLLDGTQPLYCSIYRKADAPLRLAQGNNLFIAASPRFAMEALGMILIAALAYGMNRRAHGMTDALPVLGALALGAQRLLPVLQQCFTSWAAIAGRRASVIDTLVLLNQEMPEISPKSDGAMVPFRSTITFDAVHFRYGPLSPWVLSGVDLTIGKGMRVGFVGQTGSGKSTAMDLLMGLLIPSMGNILVDGNRIDSTRVRAWQRQIAHVPQNIFLTDASVAENIAFGVPPDQIDMTRVRKAAAQAQIADFIESGADGYLALVGERGVRISGGQKQRIGIARALYKEATILVFDEATSALDTATEQSVMDAIECLDANLTILIIAHRLSTVRRCDLIVELGMGRVIAQGTYAEMVENSASFRQSASST